jgi:hypothetical protein
VLPGLALLLGGYTLVYFGWDSLQGPGTGLLDLIVPGRYKGPTKASGIGPADASGSATPAGVAGAGAPPNQGVTVGPSGIGVTISDQPAPNVSVGPNGSINVSIGG